MSPTGRGGFAQDCFLKWQKGKNGCNRAKRGACGRRGPHGDGGVARVIQKFNSSRSIIALNQPLVLHVTRFLSSSPPPPFFYCTRLPLNLNNLGVFVVVLGSGEWWPDGRHSQEAFCATVRALSGTCPSDLPRRGISSTISLGPWLPASKFCSWSTSSCTFQAM